MEPVKHTYRQLDDAFTEREAWFLFKTVAILETIGWTMLITGILFSHFAWPGHGWVLPIAGSLHGMFVVGYMLIVFFTHRSMRWSTGRMLVGEVINAVPYGALVFEQWAIRHKISKK